jgi:uncharacterized protein
MDADPKDTDSRNSDNGFLGRCNPMTHMCSLQMSVLLAAGLLTGFSSGLLGVGGAFIMVPVQFWMLKSMGVDPTIAVRISFGTSLLVVLPTAVSSAITHHRQGAVHWKAGVILGVTGASAAFVGAYVASQLSDRVLTTAFGCVSIFLAMRMLILETPDAGRSPVEGSGRFIFWGILFGLVSGIIGVGGGGLMIPVLINVLGFGVHEAVGTSAALMIFTALGGSISYLINGLGVEGLPAYSTGYLNWLQFALLAGSSIPMAVVGAKAAHVLSSNKLRIVFAMLLLFIGLKMAGVFSWFSLPF